MRKDFSAILLLDEENKVLLQYRGPDFGRWPDCWGLFGGMVDPGEDHLKAIIRESKEELDFDCKNPVEFRRVKLEYEDQGDGELAYFYERIAEENKSKLKLLEGQGWGWMKISEAKKISNLIRYLKEALEELEEVLSQKHN